jgi:hypothetical protein
MAALYTHIAVNVDRLPRFTCAEPFSVVEAYPGTPIEAVSVSVFPDYTAPGFDVRTFVLGGWRGLAYHRELAPGGFAVRLAYLSVSGGYTSPFDVGAPGAIVIVTASAAPPNYSWIE